MVWESILFMFWMCLGAFQMIASWARLEGMSFFKHRMVGYAFGVAMVVGSFCWFFFTMEFGEGGPRGQHDDQFLSFASGILGALLFTWLLASAIKSGSFRPGKDDGFDAGIEVFRKATFWQVIQGRFEERN